MSTDRELRDRIEALEATVTQLTTEAASMRDSLKIPLAPIFAVERREASVFEWFGTLPEPIVMLISIFAATQPAVLLGLALAFGLGGGGATYVVFGFMVAWPPFIYAFLVGGYRTGQTLHQIRATLKR